MENGNWIKLYRKLTKWEWYSNTYTKCVFLHLILFANYCDRRFEGRLIKRGQIVTSLSHLSRDLNISVQSIRTALKNLKSTGEITVQTTSKYSIITLMNYDSYQSNDSDEDTPITQLQQTVNSQPTVISQASGSQPTIIPQASGSQPTGDSQAFGNRSTDCQQQVKKFRNKEVNNLRSQEVKNCFVAEEKSFNDSFVIPTFDEIFDYCKLNNLNVNITKFYEYYDNYHWRYAGKPVNWKNQLNQWDRTEYRSKPRTYNKGFNDMPASYDLDEYENFSIFDEIENIS